MAINYSISRRINPQAPEGAKKFYASAQASGEVDINSLAEEVAYATSLTDGDVINAIRALTKRIIYHVTNGRIVRLEALGDFRASISGEGTDTEEEYNTSKIRSVKVLFRPGSQIRTALSMDNLKFKRVLSYKKQEEAAENGETAEE